MHLKKYKYLALADLYSTDISSDWNGIKNVSDLAYLRTPSCLFWFIIIELEMSKLDAKCHVCKV